MLDPDRVRREAIVADERHHSDLLLLSRLRATIDEALSQVLAPGSRIAFVNFPNISNVGDHVLWLGTQHALARLNVDIAYVCEPATYDPAGLETAGEIDAILINGGGNFGDLWRGQQQTREQLLADFCHTPTIQLPQSVWFDHPENLERVQHLLAHHRAFTALWREQQSLDFAHAHLPGRHLPCPDMSLALAPRKPSSPSVDILWLARTDQERATPPPETPNHHTETVDWVHPNVGGARTRTAATAIAANHRATAALKEGHHRLYSRLARLTYPPIARHHLRRGIATLSRGRVVITDRLHGHLLALLLGRDHIVLDNSYGKVSSTYQTWTGTAQCANWATDAAEAIDIAQRILDKRPRFGRGDR